MTASSTASQKVASTIADISSASGEQANGIDEMSQAVAHLDEMTQQNAALAEESAASASSLTDRIGQLNALVAAFRTGREGAPAQPALHQAAGTEPARLQQLAQAAFVQSRNAAAKTVQPGPRPPAKKVANSRGGDTGWEEF